MPVSKDDHWLNNSVVSRIARGPGFESRSGHDFFLPCDIWWLSMGSRKGQRASKSACFVVPPLFHVGRHLLRTLKNFYVPAEDRTGNLSILRRALYHVALKAGLYRKAVQVYYIPNQYPVTPVFLRFTKVETVTGYHLSCLIH